MMPSFLITAREVIEASLIVATVLGALVRLKKTKSIKTVWTASFAALTVSIVLLLLGSILGLKMQELYSRKTEEIVEGVLMIISAGFITWAVFFLHNYFGRYKTNLLRKIKNSLEENEQKGLFILVFTAVLREGFEIILFLSTIYFSSNPAEIFSGFGLGVFAGVAVSFAFFTTAVKLPVYYAFRFTSGLLILFAAGLLARGIHEFTEAGVISEVQNITFALLPAKTTIIGDMLKAVLGITQTMNIIQLALYAGYTVFMGWWVFIKNPKYKIRNSK